MDCRGAAFFCRVFLLTFWTIAKSKKETESIERLQKVGKDADGGAGPAIAPVFLMFYNIILNVYENRSS